jgi:hypothetical protein
LLTRELAAGVDQLGHFVRMTAGELVEHVGCLRRFATCVHLRRSLRIPFALQPLRDRITPLREFRRRNTVELFEGSSDGTHVLLRSNRQSMEIEPVSLTP